MVQATLVDTDQHPRVRPSVQLRFPADRLRSRVVRPGHGGKRSSLRVDPVIDG